MRSAFVIPVGDSVTSRCSFSDESSIIGKYDKRAAPPTKGIGTVKNLAELTLQIRTYLAIGGPSEVRDVRRTERSLRRKEALFQCVTFFRNVRCNWTPSESLRVVKSFTIPA